MKEKRVKCRIHIVILGSLMLLASLYPLGYGQDSSKDSGLTGKITTSDPRFGNLITDISSAQFSDLGYRVGDQVHLTIAGKPYELPFVHAYNDVPQGKPLLIISATSNLAIAVNHGNAQTLFGVTPPSPITIRKK